MKTILFQILGLASLFAGFLALQHYAGNGRVDVHKSAPKKVYQQPLGEGVCIQSGAYPDLELIRFESCRVEKQKIGGFALGGFNILYISDLEMTVPVASPLKKEPSNMAGNEPFGGPHSDVVGALLETEPEKLFKTDMCWTGVEIKGVTIYAGENSEERALVVKAESLTGNDRHPTLKNCRVRTPGGRYQEFQSAQLCLDRPVRIMADKQVINLERVLSELRGGPRLACGEE